MTNKKPKSPHKLFKNKTELLFFTKNRLSPFVNFLKYFKRVFIVGRLTTRRGRLGDGKVERAASRRQSDPWQGERTGGSERQNVRLVWTVRAER